MEMRSIGKGALRGKLLAPAIELMKWSKADIYLRRHIRYHSLQAPQEAKYLKAVHGLEGQ